MNKKYSEILGRFLFALAVFISNIVSTHTVLAEDIIRIYKPDSEMDQRHLYNNAVLSESLEKTIQGYGEYRIEALRTASQRDRSLVDLIAGQIINVHIVPTQNEWEEKAIPIRIPIQKGILGYRLFLIKRQDLEKFSHINSMDELKALRAGLRQQWSTTRSMEALGFNVITGSDYEGLFLMLISGRFDYFPRGVNEIFIEFSRRNKSLPDMAIEQSKALYLPMPTYVFVSPKYPKLAERIEVGLWKIIKDGSFDQLFWKYHKSDIQQAALAQRQIFTVDNPFLSPETPFDRKELWLDLLTTP